MSKSKFLLTTACMFSVTSVGLTGNLPEYFGSVAVAQGAPSNYVEELLIRAERALAGNPSDPESAASMLAEAVKADNPKAMLLLGQLYATGQGVDRNYSIAKSLLEKAIAGGVETLDAAWISLGDLHRLADPRDRNPALAIEAYQKAVDLGNKSVLVPLAVMIASGDGVPNDLDRAKQLLLDAPVDTKAGAAAAAEAWAALGDLYRNAGGATNYAGAVEAYELALKLGNSAPIVTLAKMIGAGQGTPTDFERARRLLNEAIAIGDDRQAQALVALGDLYRDAAPDRRDLARAADAYQRAIDLGDTDMIIGLAQLLSVGGEGVRVDLPRAKSLLDMAIGLGGDRATAGWLALGDLYRYADPDFRDLFRAAIAYEQAASAGDPNAMVYLARMRLAGEGVAVDFASAKGLLEQAISSGRGPTALAWSALGDVLSKTDNPDRNPAAAADAYSKGADLGDVHAMVRLARMLTSGEEVEGDHARAKRLLESAIARGGPETGEAWELLGDLFADSDSDFHDDAMAVQTYQQASALDPLNIPVWRALGDLYSGGAPAVRNPDKAVEAYTLAADGGDSGAMIALALMLETAEFDRARSLLETAVGAGGTIERDAWLALGDLYLYADADRRDPTAAADAYRRSANLGALAAMIKLAQVVGYGDDGVPVDFERARRLLEQAIARGAVTSGWSALGDLYANGPDDHRSPAQAVEAYRKAAEAGQTGAMIKLARIVGPGDGVPADFALAKSWLEKAIAADDAETLAWAWSTLGNLYARDESGNRNAAAAVEAYQNAVNGGDTGAMVALGQMLAFGDGIEADFPRAESLLRRAIAAADGNTTYAWVTLGDIYRDADPGPHNMARAADAYLQAVNRGSSSAMIRLAQILGSGDGVDKDFPMAIDLLQRAIAADNGNAAWAWTTLGGLYRDDAENGDLAKAAEAYRNASDLGNAGATIALARILASDPTAEFDAVRTILETVIASGGDSAIAAWGMLGDLYAGAPPEHADAGKAIEAYRKALEGGGSNTMIKLARILGASGGVPGFDEAESLLMAAISANDGNQIRAWSTLGDLYNDAPEERFDPAKAAAAYRNAIAGEDVGSMIKLAKMIMRDEGVGGSFDEARSLLNSAIAKGGDTTTWALSTLGDLYVNADEANVNYEEGAAAYQKAVEGGDTGSMIKLARMLMSGSGVEQSYADAQRLLEQAVAVGDGNQVWAWRTLGDLHRREGDPATALKYYEMSAAAGDPYGSLAAALIISREQSASSAAMASMTKHYRAAAAEFGVVEVAKEMYNLRPNALYFTVQVFLSEILPERLAPDGVYGARSAEAVKGFCAAKGLTCDGTIITLDFLEAMLQAEPPQQGAS